MFRLFRYGTMCTFNTSNKHEKRMEKFHLRMQMAALRQLLRDREKELTQDQINEILDLLIKLQKELDKD